MSNPVFGLHFEEQLPHAVREELLQLVAALQIAFQTVSNGTPVGQVIYRASANVPTGYLLCDGSAVNRLDYAALFAEIGTVWGVGDGVNTFNLPNPPGRTVVAAGQGTLLTNRILGQTFGAETVVLAIADIPAHTHVQDSHNHTQDSHNHTQNAHNHNTTDFSHHHATPWSSASHDLASGTDWTGPGMGTTNVDDANSNITINNATATNQATTATNQTTTATNQNAGGGGAHQNTQPSIVLTAFIKY